MKKVVALGVGLLMMGTASQASASFETGNVIMSIYDAADNYEMGIDLGTLSDVTSASNVTLYSGLSFSGWNFSTLTSGIGIFMNTSDNVNGIYSGAVATARSTGIIMTTSSIDPSNAYNTAANYSGLSGKIYNWYSNSDTDHDGVMTGAATFAASYVVNMQNGKNGEAGTPAFYTGMVSEPTAEAEFPVLTPYVDLYLYQFDTNLESYEIYQVGDSFAATIRLTASGDVILNPTSSEVPVPGAVWLLGSGLVGLAGLRRKHNC